MQEVNAELGKELRKILKENQLKRLRQIALQVEGLAALGRPKIAKQVGLTEEQQHEKRRAIFQQGPSSNPQATFQEMRKIRDWVNEQIEKLLTER